MDNKQGHEKRNNIFWNVDLKKNDENIMDSNENQQRDIAHGRT